MPPPGSLQAQRLGPAIIAVVMAGLSFLVGLWLLPVAKMIAPADGAEPAAEVASDPRPQPPETDAPPNVEPNFDPAIRVPEGAKPWAGEPRDVILRLKGGDSRVELANTVGLLNPRGDFTVEMWARINNADGTQRFFGDRVARYKPPNSSVYGGWECGPQFFDRLSGRLWANIAGADRDVGGAAGGGFNVTPVWHHVAYVNLGNRCIIYLDGRETLQTQAFWAPGPASSSINLSIGASPEGDKRTFYGDVRAFRATSKSLYTQRFVPPRKFQKDAGTVILLDFAGAGTWVKDLAGNHDGKIVNADWVLNAPLGPQQMPDKLTTPGLRITPNSFVELANTAGVIEGEEFCVEAWIKTPAFTKGRFHLFDDRFGGGGWGLHFNPSNKVNRGPEGNKQWEAMFNIGGQVWYENYELEPLTIYHIAVVHSANGTQVFFNGEPPGGGLIPDIWPGKSNFIIGHKMVPVDPPESEFEIHAFRASSRARYRGGFIPQQQFDKDADTLILLEFSGTGTTLKDLAGNHDGRITNATWVRGTR